MTFRYLIPSFVLFLPLSSYAERPAEFESPAAIPPAPVVEQYDTPIESEEEPGMESTQTTTTGDVLLTPDTTTGGQIMIRTLDFPLRGMDMSKVKNELGEPLQRYPAVGQPPITRWEYPDRNVYFEYESVIHAVAK